MFEVDGLKDLPEGTALGDLSSGQLTLLQRGLGASCYNAGPVDGMIGSKTRTAYADLADDLGIADHASVSGHACTHLDDRAGDLREILSRPSGAADDVKARIRELSAFAGFGMPEQVAYVLATAEHETNATYQPVREAYWVSNAEDWRKRNLRYWPYYGRGYVQLTWENNYKLYSGLVNIDLVADPDAALRHDVSLFVLVQGMKIGGFTGKKLEDYVRPGKVDFVNARRVINGTDRAEHIAEIAQRLV